MYLRKIIAEEFKRLHDNLYLIAMLIGLPIFLQLRLDLLTVKMS